MQHEPSLKRSLPLANPTLQTPPPVEPNAAPPTRLTGDTLVAEAGDALAPQHKLPLQATEEQIVAVLRQIHDPEISVNLYDLGLIYGIDVAESRAVTIRMTLTAPACPVADSLVREVAERVAEQPCVGPTKVHLVWDPPWTQERMSDAARLELGLF